jgi:hypothetical protein
VRPKGFPGTWINPITDPFTFLGIEPTWGEEANAAGTCCGPEHTHCSRLAATGWQRWHGCGVRWILTHASPALRPCRLHQEERAVRWSPGHAGLFCCGVERGGWRVLAALWAVEPGMLCWRRGRRWNLAMHCGRWNLACFVGGGGTWQCIVGGGTSQMYAPTHCRFPPLLQFKFGGSLGPLGQIALYLGRIPSEQYFTSESLHSTSACCAAACTHRFVCSAMCSSLQPCAAAPRLAVAA